MTDTFSQVFYTYRNRFVSFAETYVRDKAVAEDIVTDAFIYYWENRHRLSLDVNTPAYIMASIKNKCLSHLRHLQIRDDVSSSIQTHQMWELNTRIATLQACEPEEFFTKEIQEIVEKALTQMPEQTKRVFILSRYENLSNKEIAAKLGISVKGVEFHITKAIKILRVELKDFMYVFLLFIVHTFYNR